MTTISNITGSPNRVAAPEPGRSSPARAATADLTTAGKPASGGGEALPPATGLSPARTSPQALEGAVRKVNDFVQNYQRQLAFSVNEETGITVVKVIDRETHEVIRQIPPEEVLAIAEQIQSILAKDGKGPEGVLVQEKA